MKKLCRWLALIALLVGFGGVAVAGKISQLKDTWRPDGKIEENFEVYKKFVNDANYSPFRKS